MVEHIRYPEFEGKGMSYYPFHGGIPPPLQPAIVNELPPPLPTSQANEAEAAEVKDEIEPVCKAEK